MDSYDRIPYESHPFPDASPAALAALARLHGLAPPPPSRCRVLELGCAAGGHLIPLAFHHPGSEFLGLDLSHVQVEAGNRLIEALGLTNCRLEQADVADFEVAEGGFDYVIAHGLYSWVPETVRPAILALCRRALGPTGVAYLSYNTQPGWGQRGVLRDLFLWHLRDLDDPEERLRQAADLAGRLRPVVTGGRARISPLATELERLAGRPASYLAHEYLEPHNRAFMLWEFVADARAAGLRYVADTELHAALPSAYGEAVEALLADVDDPVAVEQYLDFLSNRGFRQSLLCRDDAPPTALDPAHLESLWLAADLAPPRKLDLARAKPQPFSDPAGGREEVHHPLVKAALAVLHQAYPGALPCPALLDEAAGRVAAAGAAHLAGQRDAALAELFGLAAYQSIALLPEAPPAAAGVAGDHPQASALARLQTTQGWTQVATVHHRGLELDAFARELLLRLDGNRGPVELVEEMLALMGPGGPLEGLAAGQRADRLRPRVRANVEALLELFRRNGLLAGDTAAAAGEGGADTGAATPA